MNNVRQRLRDACPYNDSFNAMEVSTADRRFEQLVERRERIIERSRFGILALNGASAIGILSNYAGLQSKLTIDPRIALIFFTSGMIAALLSIFFETIFIGYRVAQMFGHLSALRRMRATLDDYQTEKSEKRFDDQLAELEQRSKRGSIKKIELDDTKDGLPSDFAYSPAAVLALIFSGGAWIAGALTILFAF